MRRRVDESKLSKLQPWRAAQSSKIRICLSPAQSDAAVPRHRALFPLALSRVLCDTWGRDETQMGDGKALLNDCWCFPPHSLIEADSKDSYLITGSLTAEDFSWCQDYFVIDSKSTLQKLLWFTRCLLVPACWYILVLQVSPVCIFNLKQSHLTITKLSNLNMWNLCIQD